MRGRKSDMKCDQPTMVDNASASPAASAHKGVETLPTQCATQPAMPGLTRHPALPRTDARKQKDPRGHGQSAPPSAPSLNARSAPPRRDRSG